MKKIVSLLLALALLCSALPVLAESEEAVVYYLQSVTMNGDTYNASDFGMSVTLTFNPDGTGTSESDGEVSEMTWVETGDNQIVLTIDGSDQAAEITEEGLLISEDSVSMLFTLTPPATADLGNVISVDDLSAFNGTWSCTYLDIDGTVTGTALLASSWEMLFGSTDTTIVVTDGSVAVFGGEADAFTFENGMLTFSVEGNDLSSQSIQLTDNGLLVLTLEGMGMACYCEPVTETVAQ